MLRDNRGRFIRKYDGGNPTVRDGLVVDLNGSKYILNTGATTAYNDYKSKNTDKSITDFLADETNLNTYAKAIDGSNLTGFYFGKDKKMYKTADNSELLWNDYATDSTKYYFDNTYTSDNVLDFDTWASELESYKRNLYNNLEKDRSTFNIQKTKLANFLELTRNGLAALTNNKVAEDAIKAEKPLLQNISEGHRPIYGDYRSQVLGQLQAAQLMNLAAKPLTSDGALQQQMLLDAQYKSNQFIGEGNAQDEAVRKQTTEAWRALQEENRKNRYAVSEENRLAMHTSAKNKAQFESTKNSLNYSQVIAPLLGGWEQRLRNEGKQLEAYQDAYNEKLATIEVWNTFDDDSLSDFQKTLKQTYLTSGQTGVDALIKDDDTKKADWIALKRMIDNEIIRKTAALKGVTINTDALNPTSDPYAYWTSPSPFNRKNGGTIYKAKLTKRTKDNDRGAKSIESSKKIAAKFAEQAIKSLYTYKDIELVARTTKKKKKYQAGGGLPFVNFTPVFATSEAGAPAPAPEKSKGENLSSNEIFELLKNVDGLPSDIDAITASILNFLLADTMDPLGLDTASIASRYLNLLGNIQKAKANKEWYDKAYDKLRADGSLNEYAVDSSGYFIGMNQEGDFERFTAEQVASGKLNGYQLLTNSNLLDIRARYPNAAFNSNLIMEAANGVSMQQITEHISKTIANLGSDKTETQIFGDQSKEVLAGLRQLQLAAQEVGQDLSISELYEASVFNETQTRQALLALNYLYQTMPTNMKALLFAKAGSLEGALELVNTLVNSKLSNTYKLEFNPKNTKKGTSSRGKTGNIISDSLELSPAQMLQLGYGERSNITIQDASSTGLLVSAITMPITTGSTGDPVGATTLEGVATSQYGGILDFTNASMGGQMIPFEGRRNIAVDGSKIYSMYLPIDLNELAKGNIVPDISLIDKVNTINKQIKEKGITDPQAINQMYEEAGLPVYMNANGTVVPQNYRRFGVLNGTAIDNAFGKNFIESRYLKKTDDEDLINNAISIMNQGRDKSDRIEYDSKSFFNFGGLLGDYDTVYLGTIFVPISNDVFLGIAGSGKTVTSEEALDLEALQLQHNRISTYKNPGQLQ